MTFTTLAADYDGTLAREGRVSAETMAALRRLKAAGKGLVLVTGRRLEPLQEIFEGLTLMDAVVAENGALLYCPATGEERLIAQPPPPPLVERLRAADAVPLVVGRSVVATEEPYGAAAQAAISDLGLDWQVILNKGSVMCLPAGVDKASGLAAALDGLRRPFSAVIGVGDGENDAVFLQACGYAVAVADALPQLQEIADLVTRGGAGDGVVELVELWLSGALKTA